MGRQNHLRISYRLEPAEYDAMVAKQRGKCLICEGRQRRKNSDHLDIDHDHATGEVRGLLCGSCNSGLGRFGDSPALLRQAADYVAGRGQIDSAGITSAMVFG